MHTNDPGRPCAADQNVERLLRRAYAPERPDTEFARRVTDQMLAASRRRVQAGPRPWLDRSRFAWGLAAAVFIALTFGAFSAMNSPKRPAGPAPVAKVKPAPAAAPVPRTETARLTPRPRTAVPDAKHLAAGDSIRTGPGERRRVILPDGSVLFLNENTNATLTAQRRVRLESGEVYVEVAPRENEPFQVTTPDRQVAALGTRFAVQAEKLGTGVVVTQGRVKVDGLDELVRTGELVAPGAKEIETAPRATHLLGWMEDLVAQAAGPVVPANPRAGGTIIIKDSFGRDTSLSLRKYHVDVHIEDGFARTTIDQTYFNHEQRRLEGTFHFPLPTDASLSRLAMYVNGELMEGGMAEREIARAIYEGIVRKMQDPALLEWVDGSTFKMRVFPLEPRQEKRIVISYTQKLPGLYGDLTYRFPAGHSLEEVRDWSFHATVEHGAQLGWNCSSHDLKVTTQKGDLLLDAAAKQVKVDRDIVLELHEELTTDREKQDATRFTSAVLDGSKYLMLRYRPKLPGVARKQRRDWVVLFESSADRNPVLARTQIEIVRGLLTNAEHDDTFAILTAGATPHLLTSKALQASPANLDAALAALESTHLVGTLDLKQAFLAAQPLLKQARLPYFVHVGSGLPGIGEKRTEELLKLIPEETRYVGVGVGNGWNRALMKTAADRSGGYFTQINPDEKVGWRAFDLLATLNTPRLLDVQVTDRAGRVTFLTQQAALAQGEELTAAGCTGTEADGLPEAVVVTGTLDGKPFRREIPVKGVTAKADYIPRTWAKLEIDRLLAENATGNKDRIVALSKAMYVMTPYTSLLVLENEAMYQQHKVDRGRKDHWAMYPCPQKIPVVTEPFDTPAPVAEEVRARLTPNEVLGTVVLRLPPQALTWAGGNLTGARLITSTEGADTTVSFDERLFTDGEVGQELADPQKPAPQGRFTAIPAPVVASTTENTPTVPLGPMVWNGTMPSNFGGFGGGFSGGIGGPGAMPGLNAPFGWPGASNGGMPFGDVTTGPQYAPPAIGGYQFSGGEAGWANPGGGLGGGGMPGMPMSTAPQSSILMRDYLNGRRWNEFSPSLTHTVAAKEGLGVVYKQLGNVTMTTVRELKKVTEKNAADNGRYLDLLRTQLESESSAFDGYRWDRLTQQGQAQLWDKLDMTTWTKLRSPNGYVFSPDAAVRTRDESRRNVIVRGAGGDALDAWLLRLGNGSGRPVATYQRPAFRHDPRVWTDLLAYAPGLNSSPADVLATLEAEVADIRPAAGRIDPEADLRLRRARAVWRSVTVDGVRITFDGAGWYTWERTLPLGLQEVVVCDRSTLWHLYPELGLGARRSMTAFHRAELNALVPWVLPPAEDLARGADVQAVGNDTVAVIPTRKDATQQLHLVFATDGRLTERRAIETRTGKVIARETYADGVVKTFDGSGKEVDSRDLALRPAAAPPPAPETKGLVLLDLPIRSRQHILTANGASDQTVPALKSEELIRLLAADAAAGLHPQAAQDVALLMQRSDIRPGLWTLLLTSGNGSAVAMPVAVQRTPVGRFLQWLQSTGNRDWSKLLDLGDGMLRNLALVAAFTQDWSADSSAVSGTEVLCLTQFVREARSPELTWAVLDAVLRGSKRPVSLPEGLLGLKRRLIDAAVIALAKAPALEEAARYEQAVLSFQAGDATAKKQFLDLFEKASEADGLPLVESTFRKAVPAGDAEWAARTRQTLARLLQRKAYGTAMALAWQCWDLGDRDLADEVLEAVQAKKPAGSAALPFTLAALEYYRYTSRLDRADRLLEELLEGSPLANRPPAWRLAAKLASERKQPLRTAECLDRALALEHAQAPVLSVQQVRQDYTVLLSAYEQQAQAWLTLQQKPPADFAARVVAAADRWRSLDDSDAAACHTASRILRSLGRADLAWDYLSTTLNGPAAEPASVLQLARTLVQEGSRDVADLAYRAASDGGLVGVAAERAANLEQAGRFDDARRLREGIR